jgi:hypothetical protein
MLNHYEFIIAGTEKGKSRDVESNSLDTLSTSKGYQNLLSINGYF